MFSQLGLASEVPPDEGYGAPRLDSVMADQRLRAPIESHGIRAATHVHCVTGQSMVTHAAGLQPAGFTTAPSETLGMQA